MYVLKICKLYSFSNLGAMNAVQKFEWEGKEGFYAADRVPLTGPEGYMEMFVSATEKLKYYWVLNAGHAVCVI